MCLLVKHNNGLNNHVIKHLENWNENSYPLIRWVSEIAIFLMNPRKHEAALDIMVHFKHACVAIHCARGLSLGLSLHLLPCFMYGCSEGSGKAKQIPRLT